VHLVTSENKEQLMEMVKWHTVSLTVHPYGRKINFTL